MPGPQKIGVDSLHIRPPPPITTTKAFTLLEKVDAFCDSCWLTGIVTKILAAGRYIVYFKHTRKEKELCLTDLRRHMEWTNGRWLHSSLDTSMASKSEKQSVYLNGGNPDNKCASNEDSVVMKESNGHVRISAAKFSEEDQQTSTSGRADYITITPTNERNKQTNANGDAISVRRSRRSTEEADAMLSPPTCNPNIKQTEVLNTGTSLALDTSMSDHQAKSSLKQSEDANQPSDPTDVEGDYEKLSVARKGETLPKPRALVAALAGNIQLEAHAETAMERSTRSDSRKPLAPPEPIVIDFTRIRSGPLLKKKTIIHEKQLDASANRETLDEPHKAGEVINVKRKRGRPPKALSQLGSPNTTEAEGVENVRQNVCVEGSSVTPSRSDQVGSPVAIDKLLQINTSAPSGPPEKVVSMTSDVSKVGLKSSKRSTAKRRTEKYRKILGEETTERDNTLILRGKKLKSINQAELPIEDKSRGDAVEKAENGVGREDNTAAGVTSSNVSDDQPLSAWLGKPLSPATDERGSMDQLASQSGETKYEAPQGGQSKENGPEKRDEMSAEHPWRDNDSSKRRDKTLAIECNTIVGGKDEELPFIKNSVIWEMIESMEILKVVPQKPHFRPLYMCKEECREGLAIGRMVTFTSIAEKISKASFEDPERMLEGYGEALGELEEHGFEIIGVRERLEKLISIKRRHDEDEKRREEIGRQIREREEEIATMEEEIEEVEKEMEEVKEKQRRMEWRKEKKEGEMRVVEATVVAVKGVLANARQEFDKLAASFL